MSTESYHCDLNYFNPNWEWASDHGKASLAGLPRNIPGSKENKNIKLCRCCLREMDKQKIPLCENTKQLQFLGFGFPLYFSLIRCCILLLFIHVISYGILQTFRSVRQNNDICDKATRLLSLNVSDHSQSQTVKCTNFMTQSAHINKNLQSQEIALRLIGFFSLMVGLIYIKEIQHNIQQHMDQNHLRISEYSIMIQQLPHEENIQRKIKEFIEKGFKSKLKVQKIIMIPLFQQFEKLENEQIAIIDKQRILTKNQSQDATIKQQIHTLESDLSAIKLKIKKLIEDYNQEYQKDRITAEKAIVILQYQNQKNQAINQFNEMSKEEIIKHFGEGGSQISIKQAPEPREIIWQNINYPTKSRYIRIGLGWVVSIIFIGVTFVVFYFLLIAKSRKLIDSLNHYSQDPVKYQSEKRVATFYVYLAMIAIILFNKFIMGLILHMISDKEKHKTAADLELSYAIKYSLCMFFTTALMTLLVEAIGFNNYFTHQYGVVEEETIMFILNSFLIPIIWLINPWYLFKRLKRKLYYNSPYLTQKQAHNLMEDVPYDMGKRIAELIKTMWFTYLYSTLIPIGSIISLGGLIFYYFVDKYNLLRKSSVISNVQSDLPNHSLILMDLTLVIYPLSTLLYDQHIRQIIHWSTIMMIVASVVFMLINKKKILGIIFSQKFQTRNLKYDEVQYQFVQNYETLHPIFKYRSVTRHLSNRTLTLNSITKIKNYQLKKLSEKELLFQKVSHSSLSRAEILIKINN